MTNEAQLLWQRIVERGARDVADFKGRLNLQPGASDEELQLLEDTLAVTLPEQVKSFYKVHNGQDWEVGNEPFVRNLTLLPISEIIANWTFLQEELDLDEYTELDVEDGIKPFFWHAKWIPVAENGAGDYVCIDTDPSETGTVGQVLYYWHDWENRSVEAKSFFEFIELCLQEALEEA